MRDETYETDEMRDGSDRRDERDEREVREELEGRDPGLRDRIERVRLWGEVGTFRMYQEDFSCFGLFAQCFWSLFPPSGRSEVSTPRLLLQDCIRS